MRNIDNVTKEELMEWPLEDLHKLLKERNIPHYLPGPNSFLSVRLILDWERKDQKRRKVEYLNQHGVFRKTLQRIKIPEVPIIDYITLSTIDQPEEVCNPKSNIDHIVELQLIKDFAIKTGTSIPPKFILGLNNDLNLEQCTPQENRKKGQIVKKVIERQELTEEEKESWKEYKMKMMKVIQDKRFHVPRSLKRTFVTYINSL